MSRKRVALAAAASAAAVLGSLILTAPPASAGPGSCSKKAGDVCLYYNSGFKGAKYGLNKSVTSYSGLTFKGGAGAGSPVWNNAASVHNLNPTKAVMIYWGQWHSCRVACQVTAPSSKNNLGKDMKNENASQEVYTYANGH